MEAGRPGNGFEEKNPRARAIPATRDNCQASMGIYVLARGFLF